MLEGELSDPRIAPSYVTDVVMAPGGKSARVFVAVHGSEAEEESTLAGLMTARAFIRSQLRDRMGVRHVPELTFAIDRSERMTGRMDELLGRLRKRDKRREAAAAAAAGEAGAVEAGAVKTGAAKAQAPIADAEPAAETQS